MKPKLAVTNIFEDPERIKGFARHHEFQGIDWSFDLDRIPATPIEESSWVKGQSLLSPFEIRYHCPFYRIDLGHDDPSRASEAGSIFRRIIRIVSKAGGKFLTLHIGLGRDSTGPLSWEATIENLRRVAQYGADHGVKVCLENLAWGWTSRPNLFEKLVRKSGVAVTLDIGHAYVCETVRTQQYKIEDFVTPHADRVLNAHVYHAEIPGRGHVPPGDLEDIKERLTLLYDIGCPWWVIEINDPGPLLWTKEIISSYLDESGSSLSKER